MKKEDTSELLFTRLRQPQTLTALLVSHFARIAVEEKGPDRIIRQGWSFVANIKCNHESKVPARLDETWWHDETHFFCNTCHVCHVSHVDMSVTSHMKRRNRFKIRQLREVRKGEKMAEESHTFNRQNYAAFETQNIHETSNIVAFFAGHFPMFSPHLDAQFCEGLPGLGWNDQQSGQGLRES